MTVSTVDAKSRFSELIRRVEENGETIVISRHGKAVAQIAPAGTTQKRWRPGGMKNRIQLLRGWDGPVDLSRFLQGDL